VDHVVEKVVSQILFDSKDVDCKLTFKRVEKEGYLISNEERKRIAAVGLLHIKNEEGENEEVVGAFTIDVRKYKWAEAEGFSQDQMIDDLTGEIFDLIGVDEVLNYLCVKETTPPLD
jgi:hypothetical protein